MDKILTITVEPKTEANRFYRKGSDMCYYITGPKGKKQAPLLKFDRVRTDGKPVTYAFDIKAEGYPLVIEYLDGKDKKVLCGPIETGRLKFQVTSEFPDLLHYSCANSKYQDMGGPIEIESKDQIDLVPLPIKKSLRNGIKLKAFKNKIYLGLESCQIYGIEETNLETLVDIRNATGFTDLKLHDFEVVAENRVIALVSGLGKTKTEKKERTFLDILIEKKIRVSSLFIIKTAPNNSILLDFPILYAFSGNTIYRVDISTFGECGIDEENEDDEAWTNAPTSPNVTLLWNEKFIFLNQDIWVSETKIDPCDMEVTCATLCNERELIIANSKGSLGLLKIEGKKFSPEWECRVFPGLASIIKCGNKIYCLINKPQGDDVKSEIYILERY